MIPQLSFLGQSSVKKRSYLILALRKVGLALYQGFVSVLTFFLAFKFYLLGVSYNLYDSLVFGIITGIFGQLGDFGESLIKRDVGVKDSGQILRGHGGILDRFDSLLFSAPLVYIYLLVFRY